MSTRKFSIILLSLLGLALAVFMSPARSAEEQSIFLPTVMRSLNPEVDTLTVWTPEAYAPAVEAAGENFFADYGVDVQVVVKPFNDIRDQFPMVAAGDTGPDIIFGTHDWLGNLVADDLLAPVMVDETRFVSETIDAFTYEGALYGTPFALENVGLFRNQTLVPAAPATWDELSQVSAGLIASDTISYGLSLPIPDPYHTYPLQTAYGGYIFGRDTNGDYDPADLGLDNAGSIAAYTWFDEEIEAGRIAYPSTWEEAHRLFEDGEAAFLITGPWALGRLRTSGVNYAISAFPSGDAGPGEPFLGAQGMMLNAYSQDQATAEAFLRYYLTTFETMEQIYLSGNRSPAYRPVLETISDPDLVALAVAGENAQPMPAIPEMDLVWGAWGDAITDIASQAQEPAAALQQAADEIRMAIGGG